jgi:hypothetical protein
MEAAGQGSSAPRAAAGRAGVCISHRMVAAAGGRWREERGYEVRV